MIFDPEKKETLDTAERRKLLPPEEILLRSGLSEGTKIADVGCGTGYFSIPAAKIVGRSGKVFAIDISKEMLEELQNRLNPQEIHNLEILQSQEYSIPLTDSAVDFVLLSNVLHEPDDRERFFGEVTRVLKTGGRLILIDWLKKEMDEGPPLFERLSPEEIESLIGKFQFNIIDKDIISGKFYYYLAEKNENRL
ncbi:MAG: class I SAM-dependent methyltransferase [Candidatus Kapaibacteriota bacterium]